MAFAAVATVRSTALQHNLRRVRESAPGCPVLAVVKADAYGHGLVDTARALDAADAFGVARFNEAVDLRRSGVDKDIVVMSGWLDAETLALAREYALQFVVYDAAQVEMLNSAVAGHPLRVWLKIDSGMGRLGISAASVGATIESLRNNGLVMRDLCLMTHLSCADNTDRDVTADQLRVFGAAIGDWEGDVSIANSAGILGWPDSVRAGSAIRYSGRNWVRPGLMLYGVSPFGNRSATECGLEAAMSFEGRLLTVRAISQGASVGYAAEWRAPCDSRIGVVNVGYADGYPWRLGNLGTVRVAGAVAPVVGRVSMDMISIDLTDIPHAKPGDAVVLWGRDPEVAELAALAGTSPYELVTGVGSRVVRRHE